MNKQKPYAFRRALNPSNRLQIRQSSRKLKRAITLFSSIVAVGTLLLLNWVIAEQRQSAEESAWNDTYNLSGAFEEQVRRVIDSIRGAMSLLKPRLAAEGAGFDLGGWVAHAPEFAATTVQVAFVGADGRLISTSLERAPKAIDLSDREHIRFHLNGGKGLFIGKPVRGRVSKKTTIQVSDRIESQDGIFAGVVVFSISPDFLTTLHRAVRLGQGGSMILVGTDGAIRASYAGYQKSGEEFIGASISGTGALKAAASLEAGALVENSPLNGKPAFFNWRRVAGYPLIVIVGLAHEQTFADANRSAAMLAVLGAAVLALTLIVTLILYREIALRVQREIALFDESRKAVRANDSLKRRHEQLLKTSAELNAERARLQRANLALARAKELAVQASQAKTSLLMNMSHAFRTPMHAILNYTSMGLKKVESNDSEKLKKYLANINSSGVRLLGMLNALLDLAKLESGKFDLRLERCDLAQIVRQSQAEIDSLFEAKQLKLIFESSAPNTIAALDKQQMLQVFINLFSNAVKFAPPQSAVKVTMEAGLLAGKEPALTCSISDEGPGIPEGELEAIFDKFTQSSKTGGAGGSGLGLAICREIVHLHRGKIWASNGPSGSAVIHIMLPAGPVPADADAAAIQQDRLDFSANADA